MSDVFELAAVVRSNVGKGASRRLRRLDNAVPAIIYGTDKEPTMLTLKANEVKKALENEAFYSHILTIDVEGNKEKAVLKAMQRHPARGDVMHMDFLRVSAKESITMKVPVHFTNEDSAPGVKEGGIVSHTVTELEIKCLPQNLPEFIEVDLGALEMDHAVHMSDLKLPKGVELLHEVDAEHDLPVASIHKPKAEAVEEAAPEAEAAPESDAAPEADDAAEGEEKE